MADAEDLKFSTLRCVGSSPIVPTMKIINLGKNPEDVEYVANCAGCDTKFAFAKKEAGVTDERGMSGFLLSIKCPVCGAGFVENVNRLEIYQPSLFDYVNHPSLFE